MALERGMKKSVVVVVGDCRMVSVWGEGKEAGGRSRFLLPPYGGSSAFDGRLCNLRSAVVRPANDGTRKKPEKEENGYGLSGK